MSTNKKHRNTRHRNVPLTNRIRVRSKRLDQVDEDKIALAFWLLAKQLVADESDPTKQRDETPPVREGADNASEEAA